MPNLRHAAVLFAALFLIAANQDDKSKSDKSKTDPPKDDKTAADKEALKGDWKVVSMEQGGKNFLGPVGNVYAFAGDALTVKPRVRRYKPQEYALKLDATKSPKQIDITLKGQGVATHGLYLIDGDKLRLCFGVIDSARPADLATKAGDFNSLFTLERIKAEKK